MFNDVTVDVWHMRLCQSRLCWYENPWTSDRRQHMPRHGLMTLANPQQSISQSKHDVNTKRSFSSGCCIRLSSVLPGIVLPRGRKVQGRWDVGSHCPTTPRSFLRPCCRRMDAPMRPRATKCVPNSTLTKP